MIFHTNYFYLINNDAIIIIMQSLIIKISIITEIRIAAPNKRQLANKYVTTFNDH